MTNLVRPFCVGCGKTPDELDEYTQEARVSQLTPNEYVTRFEGTYNPENGHFTCTKCYVEMGLPGSRQGWKAP